MCVKTHVSKHIVWTGLNTALFKLQKNGGGYKHLRVRNYMSTGPRKSHLLSLTRVLTSNWSGRQATDLPLVPAQTTASQTPESLFGSRSAVHFSISQCTALLYGDSGACGLWDDAHYLGWDTWHVISPLRYHRKDTELSAGERVPGR